MSGPFWATFHPDSTGIRVAKKGPETYSGAWVVEAPGQRHSLKPAADLLDNFKILRRLGDPPEKPRRVPCFRGHPVLSTGAKACWPRKHVPTPRKLNHGPSLSESCSLLLAAQSKQVGLIEFLDLHTQPGNRWQSARLRVGGLHGSQLGHAAATTAPRKRKTNLGRRGSEGDTHGRGVAGKETLTHILTAN
jgi:hypothetical protein